MCQSNNAKIGRRTVRVNQIIASVEHAIIFLGKRKCFFKLHFYKLVKVMVSRLQRNCKLSRRDQQVKYHVHDESLKMALVLYLLWKYSDTTLYYSFRAPFSRRFRPLFCLRN